MKLHEMKQKRATIAGQMRKLHDENSEKRWDEALTKQWGDMNQELRDLDAAIARGHGPVPGAPRPGSARPPWDGTSPGGRSAG